MKLTEQKLVNAVRDKQNHLETSRKKRKLESLTLTVHGKIKVREVES